ncbi:MAG: hypothetical protein LBD85_03575 [Oscillospiraceae bacterium]|jgi:hypothetical protein|nr:hypothetical protein [Oscillospiraceae bacterium]
MKKRSVFALITLLCAVLVFVMISHAYAQQEETQSDEAQDIIDPSAVPETEDPDQTDTENTESANEPEQPEPTETPDVSDAPESFAEPESEPLPPLYDTSELPDDPEEESAYIPNVEEPTDVPNIEETTDVPNAEEPTDIQNVEELAVPNIEEPTDVPNTEEPTDVPDTEETPLPEEIKSNPAVAAEIEFALTKLEARINYVASLIGASDNYELIAGDDNFYDALAVYAIRHNQTENYPYGVVISDEKQSDEFQSIFWSLNSVSAAKTGNGAIVRVSRLSAVRVYALSGAEAADFDILNSNENRESVRMLLSE